MTQNSQGNLSLVLETEIRALETANAERLSGILRGLFACMKDLDSRLSRIEEKLEIAPDTDG